MSSWANDILKSIDPASIGYINQDENETKQNNKKTAVEKQCLNINFSLQQTCYL